MLPSGMLTALKPIALRAFIRRSSTVPMGQRYAQKSLLRKMTTAASKIPISICIVVMEQGREPL